LEFDGAESFEKMSHAVTCDLLSLDVGAPEYMIVGFDGGVA
jgi:hypothetical protein